MCKHLECLYIKRKQLAALTPLIHLRVMRFKMASAETEDISDIFTPKYSLGHGDHVTFKIIDYRHILDLITARQSIPFYGRFTWRLDCSNIFYANNGAIQSLVLKTGIHFKIIASSYPLAEKITI